MLTRMKDIAVRIVQGETHIHVLQGCLPIKLERHFQGPPVAENWSTFFISCNVWIFSGGSAHQLSHGSSSHRRSSNASDCTHRSRTRRRECPHSRGRLERAISSDSRLTGAIPKCHHHHHFPSAQTSSEQASSSDTDIRNAQAFAQCNVLKH